MCKQSSRQRPPRIRVRPMTRRLMKRHEQADLPSLGRGNPRPFLFTSCGIAKLHSCTNKFRLFLPSQLYLSEFSSAENSEEITRFCAIFSALIHRISRRSTGHCKAVKRPEPTALPHPKRQPASSWGMAVVAEDCTKQLLQLTYR